MAESAFVDSEHRVIQQHDNIIDAHKFISTANMTLDLRSDDEDWPPGHRSVSMSPRILQICSPSKPLQHTSLARSTARESRSPSQSNSNPKKVFIKEEAEEEPAGFDMWQFREGETVDLRSDDEGEEYEIPAVNRPRLGSPFRPIRLEQLQPRSGVLHPKDVMSTRSSSQPRDSLGPGRSPPVRTTDVPRATSGVSQERLLNLQRRMKEKFIKRTAVPNGKTTVTNIGTAPTSKPHRTSAPIQPVPKPLLDQDREAREFEKAEKQFRKKQAAGLNTLQDEVEYKLLKKAESTRLKKIYEDAQPERSPTPPSPSDDGLFVRESVLGGEAPDLVGVAPAPKKRGRKRKSETADGGPSKRQAKGSKKKTLQSGIMNDVMGAANAASRGEDIAIPEKGRGKNKKSAYPDKPIANIITKTMRADVFADTAETAHLRNQPNFQGRTTRKDALRDLLASVPAESKKIAKVDRDFLEEAVQNFRKGAVTASQDGDWKVNGMKTTLKHYQILGVSFMHTRENDTEEPRGGILADEMGLGKTVMMLANIITGRPRDKDVPRTTLVVASPALIRQWNEEIVKHCKTSSEAKTNGLGRTLVYRSKDFEQLGLDQAEKAIRKCDIVLTTYQEVIKSYPKAPVPSELVTAGQKDRWWQTYYKEHRDALHRVKFHRIVLDEAQAIKNHTGVTSMACRSVTATHHWAISGTPIMNTIQEFYPYFKFIKEPHTGSFKIFKENFCSPDDPDGTLKLNVFLSKFMIRRTHVDRLFDARLLDLPKPTEETFEVEFNETERQIYEIIRNRFVQRVKCIAESPDSETKKCNHVWTMILRLRQVCSHLLLAQDTLTDILEREDFERLSRLMLLDRQEQEEQGLSTMLRLRQLFTATAVERLQQQSSDTGVITSQQLSTVPSNFIDITEAEDQVGHMHGLKFNFERIIQDLVRSRNFDEICERTRCACCRQKPHNPHVTSCYHIYCLDCLEHMQHKAARRGHDDARCIQCGEHFNDSQPCQDVESITGTKQDSRDSPKRGKGGKNDPSRWVNMPGDMLPSAKTIALKMRVIQWLEEDPDCKIIVYSQFLDMIRILGRVCDMERWGYCKYTGSMSHPARDKAIQDFRTKPEKNILLASLKCGGLGLNLTMASRVVCLDPWWNNAVEQQAFCRVFRIGQQKETFMTRIIVKNSIDTAMMSLKARKKIEIDEVMDEDRKKDGFTLDELAALFQPQSSSGEDEVEWERRPFIFAAPDDDHDPEEGLRIVDVEDEDYDLPHSMGHEA